MSRAAALGLLLGLLLVAGAQARVLTQDEPAASPDMAASPEAASPEAAASPDAASPAPAPAAGPVEAPAASPKGPLPAPAAASAPPAAAGPDPNDPASWIDPAGKPEECKGGFFSGQEWNGDEIECKVGGACDKGFQLACEHHSAYDDYPAWIGCDVDRSGLASMFFSAIEFKCVVDYRVVPQNRCDWVKLQADLLPCMWEPVRRILATWNATG